MPQIDAPTVAELVQGVGNAGVRLPHTQSIHALIVSFAQTLVR